MKCSQKAVSQIGTAFLFDIELKRLQPEFIMKNYNKFIKIDSIPLQGTLKFCIHSMNKPSYKYVTVHTNTCTKRYFEKHHIAISLQYIHPSVLADQQLPQAEANTYFYAPK